MRLIIRWLCALTLLALVQRETGWFTATALFLTFVETELNWLLWRRLTTRRPL